MYFVVTLALKMLIYALVNSAFSGFAAPRLSESRGCLQTMPSVSGEKALKPKTTSFYSLSYGGLTKLLFSQLPVRLWVVVGMR